MDYGPGKRGPGRPKGMPYRLNPDGTVTRKGDGAVVGHWKDL
jgi:hypothetical protein